MTPATGGRPASRPVRRRRFAPSLPRELLVITGLWVAMLLGASLIWPMSYGYDEPAHVNMAYRYADQPFHFYGPGDLRFTDAVEGYQKLLPGIPPVPDLAAAPVAPRDRRPSLAQLGGETISSSPVPDQMVEHPPLYYWVEALVMRLPGVSHLSWDLEIWLMRLASVAMMAPVPVLCWEAARRLLAGTSAARGLPLTPTPEADRVALLAAAIPLSIPGLVRDGSAVTNDALLILSTSVVLVMVARVSAGDLSRRTASVLALGLAAALLTKGFALVLPPVVVAAYLMGWTGGRPAARPASDLLRPLGVCLLGAAVGAVWWLRNLIEYRTVQVNGYGSYIDTLYGRPTGRGTFGPFLHEFIGGMTMRIWGGIGLPDQPSPGPLIEYGWLAVLVIGMAVALLLPGGYRGRARALLLMSAAALVLAVVFEGSWSDWHKWPGIAHGVQGRYLYSSVVGFAAVSAAGFARYLASRVVAALTAAVVALAVVTNLACWVLVLRSWYRSPGPGSFAAALAKEISTLLRWSPVPSGLTLMLALVLPVLAGAGSAVWMANAALRENVSPAMPALP